MSIGLPRMSVRYVKGDDWSGLYVNGKLEHQGHSIPTHIWLALLKAEVVWLDEVENGLELLEEDMRLPENWGEVKKRYGI